MVEQWTENPCVPGSIPGGTTFKPLTVNVKGFVFFMNSYIFNSIHSHFLAFKLMVQPYGLLGGK